MVTRVCFDSNAWIALLNDESDKDLGSLREWLTIAARRDARLIVPAIVAAEVAVNPDLAAVSTFESLMQRPEIDVVDITTTVASFAGKLRRQTLNANKTNKSIKTVRMIDALVIASSHLSGADYLLSHDIGVQKLNGMFGIAPQIGPFDTGLPKMPLFDDNLND
ncbi:MAG: PIN domain-containing protein [Rubripirellula sp.]